MKHDTNIIREYENGQWVVCQRYKTCNYNRFLLATETGSTAQVLTLFDYSISINDMEINGDIVYFCGEMVLRDIRQAILGYFDMNGFPTTTVYACIVEDLISFKKMEVFMPQFPHAKIHIAMTGQRQNGKYCMVDATEYSSNVFDFFFVDIPDDLMVLDDVTVSDNYVVFSARGNIIGGWLLFHQIPATGTTFFGSYYKQIGVGVHAYSPMLLESCGDDTIVHVTNSDPFYTMISFFNGYTWKYSCFQYLPQGDYQIKDVKYDLADGSVDILFDENLTYNSVLVTFPSIQINTRTLYGHRYKDQRLYSLDYLNYQPGLFIASGQSIPKGPLRIYRYSASQWDGCAELFQTNNLEFKQTPSLWDKEPLPNMQRKVCSTLEHDYREETIQTICEIK